MNGIADSVSRLVLGRCTVWLLACLLARDVVAQAPLEYFANTGGYVPVQWTRIWSVPQFRPQLYTRLNSIDWYIGATLSTSASITNNTNNTIFPSINASTSLAVSGISPGFDQRAFASASGSTSIRARGSGTVAGTRLGEVSGSIPSSDFQRFIGNGNVGFTGYVPPGTPSVSSGGGTVNSRSMSVFGGVRITYNYTWIGQSQSDPISTGSSTPAALPSVPSGRWLAPQFSAGGIEVSATNGEAITNVTLPVGTHEWFIVNADNQFIGAYEPGSNVTFPATGVTRCQVTGLNAITTAASFPLQAFFSTSTANIQVRRLAAVSDRRLYYKGSGFESNGGATAALDSSKSLLSPTSIPVPSTFSNVSNYSFGINGVTIDVLGLASTNLTSDDFRLRVLDGNQPTTTPPKDWAQAPAPSAIVVTPGTQTTAARVQLEWPDNAIQNCWLQIVVLSNSRTGLANPAVYYLGHAACEVSGTSPYRVSGADLSLVQSAIGNALVGIDDVRDINKDRRVSGADLSQLQTRISNAIVLSNITIPPIGSAEEDATLPVPPNSGEAIENGPLIELTSAEQ